MKADSLIIDVRRQLPWHKRYFSTTTTAMMWAGWLLLWRPFILVWVLVELQKTHIAQRLMSAFSDGIEHGVTALFMCAVALLLWGLLPAKRVHKKHAVEKTLPDYARYFELPEQEIQVGRQQKVSIVHHDENGKIIRVE
ncbi:poly-beta-1,6-N-acetyl-D-glucosamine biosynthesis protein PgaD [Acinetobacter sp. ANC 3929]|uniref:poly-beta-1,6-N-acetyl-D-glucosamine biosynthesis protein PgaD n=1 Tax=unclassified Acinetobacter TaxID=196816 RepID=UPI0002CD8EF5|nr:MULTISPECIES: poly-beta-1,6-N-acetyl-D-glucosamine biosynthesis protein PgaD [unclassified Acinetobacter]ENW78610.1 poly-beta-1,6-N-acetyl-D-glucosamine biosynthesis protein PgaD [Acinetobacter sp. ANC 3929]MCH7351571.1 poly-beta-1,6-N-acetyl-D-glucosamine biosynthesis protein PgaD [Acinetobacter sp. NIPH 2023]MCH7355727.1 poly-beta-1,6-N-acetyl-D-glucosamine biosynthesis protein PgaD [Acinetobacter sp. NIPH 1958]MCH7359248.1 poly-beta-1,6-N-acetyl-D-glucosamine biosynthesis protein PgaD [Ac